MTTAGVDHHLEAAEALIDARRFDEALEVVSQALARDPSSAVGHSLACRALMGRGRYREAVQAASRTVSLAPHWPIGHRLVAIAIQKDTDAGKLRQNPAALQAARESVRLAPTDPFGYTTLAETLAKAGQFQDADAAIRRAIGLGPARAEVWVSASYVAIRTRHWLAAENAARRALSLDPDNYSATNNLGVALHGQGYWPLGAVAYHGAASIDPRSATARDNVEAIGFRYLATLAPLMLLPLLIVTPVFVAVRLSVSAWLAKRPQKLRPLARRIGVRVASSKRYKRKFDRHNAHVTKAIAGTAGVGSWSALEGRRRVSSSMLCILGGGLLSMGLACVALAASVSTTARGQTVSGLVALACSVGGLLLICMAIRRTTG